MEIEMKDDLGMTVERLAAAASLLEQAVERLTQRQTAFAENAEASLGRIVATVDARREAELEEKLAAAELKLAELQARSGGHAGGGRKTFPSTGGGGHFAKQGMTVEAMDAGALDAALVSLSLEQRIAVKAQLLRAGFLG